MKRALILTITLLVAGQAQAAVKTKAVDYTYDGVTMKGVLAWDDAVTGKRPGVLVVHEFWGINDYAKKRAEQLAGMGYVAFAADMYGDGKLVNTAAEAGKLAKGLRDDPKAWMGRANAALKVLQDDDKVDATKLAAIGYCFGGSTALEMAQNAAPLKAAVGFHAALSTIDPEKAKNIKGKILICHGADDAFIPEKDIEKMHTAYKGAKVDYKFISYPGVVHSFTVPDADARMMKNVSYNKQADENSWAEMTKLFKETLK